METAEKLPVRLGKSPLVEALFELRFTSHLPAASILSGLLYTSLKCSEIIKLPHADIPDQIRQAEPNLTYMPVIRLKKDNFYINLSDRSILVSVPHPYVGWNKFRETILEVLKAVASANIVDRTERFSLKYIDIFDMAGFSADGKGFTLGFKLPAVDVMHQSIQGRFEVRENPWIHVIGYFGEAHGNLPDGTSKKGIMMDVDTIEFLNSSYPEFIANSKSKLDELHNSNKKLFFKLISEEGLNSLEPKYE